MQNRVFFPQTALDEWISDGSVDLQQTELTILDEGRRYRLAEAVRVMREVTGSTDSNELVGKVKSIAYLQELGGEIVESSMILGDNAYDVVPGWLGAPVGTFEEHAASPQAVKARAKRTSEFGDEPRTDEGLLARFLEKHL
jgi:hypothetical protein